MNNKVISWDIPVSEGEETECGEQGEGNQHCPLCNSVMMQMAGMVSCTNPMCPNNKGMAA